MSPSTHGTQSRTSRAGSPNLFDIFWGSFANGCRRLTHWRKRGVLGEALQEYRRRSMRFEALEPRLLLSADINYVAASGAALDAALRIADVDGTQVLQLVDNGSNAVLGEGALDQDINVTVGGSDLNDSLIIDFNSAATPHHVNVNFDGGAGDDTLRGPADNTVWTITGANAGSAGAVSFSGVENLEGAADNEDTFVVEAGGSVSGVIEGGAGGFDTIEIRRGGYSSVVSAPTGPSSGWIALDGNMIRYAGFEPVLLDLDLGTNVEFDLGTAAGPGPIPTDVVELRLSVGDTFILDSLNNTFEDTTFTDPGVAGSVLIKLGAGSDIITLKNLGTLDASLEVRGETGDDIIKFDDDWGDVTLVEAAGEGTDTLDFGPYSDVAPRDSITITPQGGGGVTIDAEAADGSSLTLSSTSADNIESLINANINLTGLADPAGDEIIGGLKDLVTFLRNVAGTATEFATALPLLGGSADVAIAKALDFAEALDEMRVQVEEFIAEASTPVTSDDLIDKLDTLFGGAGRTLSHLGASILSPRAVTDTDVVPGDTYAFSLSLDGGGPVSISATGAETVPELVAALNLELLDDDATNGVVIAAQRNGRIAFQVVGTEVDTFSVSALAGAAQSKLGYSGSAVSLSDVQDILRNLGSLNVKLTSGVTLDLSWNGGEPQLRFDVDYEGKRNTNFFYNFGAEAQGMGLAFDLDAKLSSLAKLVFDFQLGLGLSSTGTSFFLDVTALRAGIETTLASDNVTNAGLNIGFLDVLASGALSLNAGITATLSTTSGITSAQLLDAGVGLVTGGSLSLTGFDDVAGFTGSPDFDVNLTISVEAGLDGLGGFSGTGTLTASGNPFTSGEDIDLAVDTDFNTNFPSFNNLSAAGVVSLIGQITGWLDELRDGELIGSIDIPFVEGGLDAILDLAEILDDALLYDEGPDDTKDGSDRLVTDLNQALAQAGLDRLIRAQGNGVKVTLIAVDPEITGFTITKKLGLDPEDSLPFDGGGYADVGFVGAPVSSAIGDAPQTIVATNDAVSRGRLSGRAAFTVTVNKPGGPVTGDVRVGTSATDSNEGIGDDVAKLINAGNAPLFSTAQELAERLDEFIPGDVSFNAGTKLLTYTISFTDIPLFTVELPVDFELNLGEIAGIQSDTRLVIESEGGFNFTLGFDLNTAPGGSAGALTGGTTLADLDVDVKLEEAATAQSAPRTVVGQLSGPATITITYNPDGSVTVPLLRTGTDINATHQADDQSETAIAVNPVNPDNIIIAVNDADSNDGIFGSVSSNDHVYVTIDGGQHWTRHTIPVPAGTPAPTSSHGDPTIVFSRDGTRAVFVHMVDKVPAEHGDDDLHVMVSAVSLADGSGNVGTSWSAANTGIVGGSFALDQDGDTFNDDDDKQFVAVGPRSSAQPDLDRFVLSWHRDGVIHVSTSLDGLVWTTPAIVGGMTGGSSTAAPSGTSIDAIPSVGPDGQIYIIWEEYGTPGVSRIMFDSSLDGGVTWGGGLDTEVLFATGLFNLDPTDTGILDAVAAQMAADPQLLVTVAGYTDTAGDAGPNQTLSDNRADAVRDYLVDTKGIDASRVVILGFGETRLADPALGEVQANRRVELTFDRVIYTGNVSVFNDFNSRAIISGATQGNPVEITTANPHGLVTGAQVFIEDIVGMTELNDRTFTVTVTSPTSFTLNGENGAAHDAYVSGGTFKSRGAISGATTANPVVITTPAAHGLVDGDTIRISNVVGMTEINGRNFDVDVLTDTTFRLVNEDGTGHTAYTSGGTWRVVDDYTIPAQPDRGIWMGLSMDVDRSGGSRDGRIYVAFADQGDLDGSNDHGTADHDDTDIFVIASDDDGATWNALASSPQAVGADQVRVNDDTTGSQFFSWLAVDQSTGNVAVSWYDARNDDGLMGDGDLNGIANDDVQYFGAVSTDFGRTWTNLQVSDGTSTARGTLGGDYGDYTGLAFVGGTVHMTWADTSDSTTIEAVNPDGDASFGDAYYDTIDLTNETLQDLLDDINAALDEVVVGDGPDGDLLPDVLGEKFEARESAPGSGIVEIVALDPTITSFTVTVANTADPAFRDLGFQSSTAAVEDESGDLVVKAGKKAPVFVGRLTTDASFDVTLAGQSPVTVTVQASATDSPFGANRSILDLVKDVQDAIDAEMGEDVIKVSSAGSRLLFTRVGATAAGSSDNFTIAPTSPGSAAELGITGTLTSDEADLVITRADGTTTHRVTLGLDEDSDTDVDIDDVILAIESATSGAVQVSITADNPTTPVNEAGSSLTLHDTTWASGDDFMVAAANGSLAAVQLGIIGTDGTPVGQAGEPDGKIIGAKIAGASLLDRVFLTSSTPSSIIDASLSIKAALLVEDIIVDNLAGTIITSDSFEFESEHVGKTLKIKNVNGFTAGSYTVNSVDEATNKATLSGSVGDQGMTGGVGVLETGVDASANVGFVGIELESTQAKLGAELSLGFNTGSTAWTNDNRLTLRELVDGISNPLSLVAPPDWNPLTGETNFADLDLTVDISLDGASADFGGLATALLGATPGVTIDVKALGDPFLGTRFSQANYTKVNDTSFTVDGDFTTKLPVGVVINFNQGGTDHFVTVDTRSFSAGETTVNIIPGFALPTDLTGYDVTLQPKVDVDTSDVDLDNLLNFEDIDFADVLAALQALFGFLDQFEAFEFLNTDIPLINQSVNDLLGFAADFADDLEAAADNPASALQVLETKINEAVGLGAADLGDLFDALQANPLDSVLGLATAPNDVVDLSLVDDTILKLDLTLGKTFNGGLDVAIPGIDFGDGVFAALGLGDVFDLAGSAGLFAQGSVMLRLQLGIDLLDPLDGFYLFEDTGLEADLTVGGENIAFRVGVGPFALSIASTEDQASEISLSAGATLGFDPSTPFDSDGKLALGDALSNLTLDFSGSATGVLPVFFPNDSNLIGEIQIGEAVGAGLGQLENIGNFTVKTDDTAPASDDFVIDVSEIVGAITGFNFDSFSIFDNIFLAIDGIDMALEFVENLIGGKIGDLNIPLVGDDLAKGAKFIADFRDDFVQPLRQGLEDAQNVAQDFSDPDENIISKLIFDLLAPASVVGPNGVGLGLLKPLDGSFDPSDDDSPEDFIALGTNLEDFLFNPATTLTLSQVFIEWDFKLGSVLADLDTDIGFDLGIPGLGLETEGEITLDVEWDLDLGFGLSGSEGFYLKVDDPHELLFDVNVAIPATITGTLGFLGLRASDTTINVGGTDYNTHLGATFAVDVKENGATGADAERLGFTEFGSIGLDAKIAADAAAALELELGLSPDLFVEIFGPDAASIISGFPKLKSDFIFLWEVGTRGTGSTLEQRVSNTTFELLDSSFGNAIEEGLQLVAFQDVRLDLGSFLSDVLGPLVDEVAKFTEPMQPIIDFITSPIPIIGELGLDITWLDLAQMIAGDALNVRLIEAISEIVTLINDIAAASDAGEIALPIGDMVLYNDSALPGAPSFTSATLWDGGMDLGSTFDQITSPGSGLLNDLVGAAGGIGDAIGDLISGGGLGGSQAEAAQTMQRVTTGSGGFSFPFLENPSEIFGLLMGEPVDLIVYDLETDPSKSALEFEFEFSQFFSIFGPLGVSIGLLVEFTADGKFGYDTLGIQQFVETGFRNPLLLLNGFYIADDPKTEGTDDPELTFLAELQAAAELNLGIARAGVAAAFGFLIEFDLFDPNDDLKIRIDELVGNFVNQLRAPNDAEKLLAPLAIFDVHGEIFARLFAFLEIDFGFFSFEEEFPIFGPVTLLSFDVDFFRPPVLASEQDTGDLIVNAGQFAEQRLLGNATDVGEHLIIKSTGTSGGYVNVEIKSGNSALGDDSQTFLPYRVRQGSKIIIDGGEGDDIFDLTGFTADGVLFDINLGAGNDRLLWGDDFSTGGVEPPHSQAQGPANKFNLIQGGSGDDFIQGSGGSDLVYGNSGNDTINAGSGSDLVFGDEGEVGAGFARGLIKPTDGRDTVDGGDGADIVFGGGGKDTVQGGSGSGIDLILGGGGLVTFTSDSAFQVIGNFEITGSVDDPEDLLFDPAAGDTILGGPDADILYGTAGADTIMGEGGDDIIFGLGGFDIIDAGGGDDVIFGDDGKMVPDGDDLNSDDDPIPLAGGEADNIDGGPGADTIFGGGGADVIQGGADDDDIYGGSGADVIFGDSGSIIGGVATPAEAGTDDGDLIFGEGEPDTIFGGGGNDVIDGGAGNDIIDGGSGADSIVTNKSNDFLDGGDGGDFYTIYFQGGTASSLMNVIDTGATGTDVFVAIGTVFDDRFLLRANTDGSIAFVALINSPFHVERVNYSFVERVVVNGSFGDDYFASDDTAGEVTLNGEFGRDIFQIGQMFKSNRGDQTDLVPPGGNDFSDVTGVHVDDAFANIETTRGWLSNGISAPMTINGGLGDDLFTVFHNKAVLQLNGEEGDDTFEIRAFALAGSQEPQRERTDISGGAGADLVQYAVNAPVNIDGGDGFDTVVVIGTEFGDDLVITEDGVFGAGLNVNFVRIESLRVDGAEGNDRFFVLSTSEKFMTEIFGGLGEDTFNMSGDTPPIVSNDLKGHSGLIVHDVESGDARYDDQSIFGISANVADNDEPFAVIRTTGGSTIVTEGGSLVDSYQIVLTRQPTKDVLIRALAPIPTPGDRERRAMAFRLDSPTQDDLSADGTSLTLRFTAGDWYIPQTVNIYADDAPLIDTSVSAAFGLFTRPEIVGEDPDADLTTGIPFDMNDSALEGVRFGVVNHLVSAASEILEGTIAAIDNATAFVAIPDTGIVSDDELVGRKLFIVKGEGAGQLRSVLTSVSFAGFFLLTLDRPFTASEVPTTTSEFFLAIDDALVGTVSDFDETPASLPPTTEPEDNRSTFTDSAAVFPTAGQGLRGAILEIIGGPGAGQQRLILGNLASDPTHTLILNGPWREDPVAGESLYRIERYDGLSIPSVTVQINDDDEAGVIVDETMGFEDDGIAPVDNNDVVDDFDTITAVIEGGDGDHLGERDVLRIRLSRDPGATINLGLNYDSQIQVRDLSGALINAGNPLVFDSTNWDDFQSVIVTATDDTLREGFHSSLIQFSVSQGTADETLDQTDNFNLIPEESAVFFVGLSQTPVEDSTVVTLNGIELTEGDDPNAPGDADYVVLSNKIVFLDGTGDLLAVFGTISVEYEYVNPGFSSAFTAPVLARIQDADAPTVLVRETGGSTDVIELTTTGTGPDSIDDPLSYAFIQALNLSPWNDSYELVLTGQPDSEVTITVSPQITKTTRTGGIRTDAIQVEIDSDDARVSDGPAAGELTVTFDGTNWDEPVVIKVRALDDAEVDGGDTQVFAPGPDTVSGILGPVFVQGAGGEGSLAMNAPLMLPGEINKRPADGQVIAFAADPSPGALEHMTVLTSVLEAKRIALGFDSIDDLIGLTVEMSDGNGTNVLLDDGGTPTPFDDKVFDRFWLIADILDGADVTQKVLHLQNPSQLDVAALPGSAVPNASSKYAITTLSANFFVDETTQVDFMFVHDEDSPADSTGYLTPTRLYGLNMGPDLVIGGQLRPGGVTFGELEVLEINLGKGNNTFNVLGTPTRREDGYQTWTFLNSGDESVPWFGVMGDTVNVTLNAADEVVRTGSVAAAANPALANGFRTTVTVDGETLAENALEGYVITVGETGTQQTRRIIGNTGNVLWVDRAWDTIPTGQAYTITDEADGALAVNTQAGNDTVDASASDLGITIFGGLGDDTLTGGSGEDIIFGDRGRVDYFNELDAVVTRLGYAPEPITGFVTAQVVDGTPGAGETDLFHLEDTGAKLSGGESFGTSFPVPDDLADGMGTDDIGLRGLYVDINNGFGFLQTIRLISDNTGTTLTLAEMFDSEVDLPGPVLGDESEYRISTYPEDQTDGVVRAPNLLITVDNDLGGADIIDAGGGNDQVFGGAGMDTISAGTGDDVVAGDAGRIDRSRDVLAPETPEIGEVAGSRYDRLRTIAFALGAVDTISGNAGADMILGGNSGDFIYGDDVTDSAGAADLGDVVIGDNGEIEFDDGVITHVFTTDTVAATGADDTIGGGAGEDILIGGVEDDTIYGGTDADIVLGDDGEIEFENGNIASIVDPGTDGDDVLAGGADPDLIVGGLGDDTIRGEGNDDILIGDAAEILYADDGVTIIQIQTIDRTHGGVDTVYGGDDDDIVIGGTNDDDLDGGLGRDLVFGDNVLLVPGPGEAINPRFRLLGGPTIYDADGLAQFGAPQPVPGGLPSWANWHITLDQELTPAHFGDDYIAGGGGNDEIFGQLGDDTIQGDGSIDFASTGNHLLIGNRVGAARTGSNPLLLNPSFEDVNDGDDYIEGNGGTDVIFGNLGQDDIIGGNSSLFSLNTPALRPDATDLIFGGAGTDVARNDLGDLSVDGHARDSDVILGDNGNIYRFVSVGDGDLTAYLAFNYDNYGAMKIVPRAAQFLDYTPGGSDFNAAQAGTNIGAADEVHGESGDDFIYGMVGNDLLYGDAQDDNMVGGYGADWMSGGTGDDGMLGDDGRLFASRNSTAFGEPLYGVTAIPSGEFNMEISTPGGTQRAMINVPDLLKYTADLTPQNLQPNQPTPPDPLFRPLFANDIIYGGWGNDAIHGGAGDDAVSGAEAPVEAYTNNYDQDGINILPAARSDFDHPFNPGNVLGYAPAGPNATKFALYDATEGMRKILLDPANGTLWKGPAAGGREWILNFTDDGAPTDLKWVNGTYTGLPTDGDDHIFGDLGNDWIVGGTGRDVMFSGWGDDLMNADDYLATNGGLNNGFDNPNLDTNPSHEDLAFGGAGRDVLIVNTNGDRAIDWLGEFNTFLTPYAQFGAVSVSRLIQPQIPEFLYALSKSSGADPTLAAQYASDPLRNGEPFGELGLVKQGDAAWQAQTGGPRDPQAGNTHGGKVDVRNNPGTTNLLPIYLTAAGSWSATTGATDSLTDAQLAPVVDEAKQFWGDVLGGDSRLALLDGVRVEVGNLPQDRLGATLGNWILIDSDAAGRGWFTDASGADSAAFSGMDLFSAVTHEIGHALGFGHDDADAHPVMHDQLDPGGRFTDLQLAMEPAKWLETWTIPGGLPGFDLGSGPNGVNGYRGIDWQGNASDGWKVRLSPYAPDKPVKNPSPNFAGFLVKLLGKDRGGAQAAAYDSLGSDLLGAKNGKGR